MYLTTSLRNAIIGRRAEDEKWFEWTWPGCSVSRWQANWFNIWSFGTLNFCQKPFKNCQSKLKILPNSKLTFSKWPKFYKITSKWRNFTNSGHLIIFSTNHLNHHLQIVVGVVSQDQVTWLDEQPARQIARGGLQLKEVGAAGPRDCLPTKQKLGYFGK